MRLFFIIFTVYIALPLPARAGKPEAYDVGVARIDITPTYPGPSRAENRRVSLTAAPRRG